MRSISIWVIALMVSLSYNCKDQKKETKETTGEMEQTMSEMNEEVSAESLQFSMEPKSGSTVKGVVNFTEENGSVKMIAELSGLSEGEHAIHIHEKADCSSDDGKSTGGHWNPTNEPHGKWGDSKGYHRGDIGNFPADAEGNATVEFETNQWCIDCDDATKNIVGKAVIVHDGVDDYTSQPSGDAGTRVSCTGIIQ
ncbi:superoxide dismutase family protein [uncultured Kriegella sp.]|uniref:superoxide dismutase family protein n=1 Tax=uncultured Kriegella sp. TaxID=1798910 RepID=UPI0030DBF7EF|tara:strand:- start:66647 stop:67234 length:588 start_codon:yes stop_codon:yes gene_type:complete